MGVGRRSLWLGLSQVIEVGLQVVLPMLLVRHLTQAAFGDYRLVWLIAAGLASMAPMGMPNTLAYFLPRTQGEERQAHAAVGVWYMLLIGTLSTTFVIASIACFGPTPEFRDMALLAGVFTGIWVSGGLLDYLPVADERGDWQARAIIVLALLRCILASAAAIHYEQLDSVFYALSLSALMRLGMILIYARRQHGFGRIIPDRGYWMAQIKLAWPIGLSSLMVSIRRQADQWIAAAIFGTVQFAIFSLGAVFGSLVLLMRRAVSSTLMPTMSKQHAAGDWDAIIDTNNRANLVVAFFALPLLAFIWCFGEPIYTTVYTAQYVGATPVMRVLMVSWLLQIVELNSIILLAGQMHYSARISTPLLLLSLAISVITAYAFGLAGAAAGGVLVAFIERSLLIRQLSKSLNIPVRSLQAWATLLTMMAVTWGLAGLGRLAYELRPSVLPPLPAMLALGAILPLPYYLIARKQGWLPHTLLNTSAISSH
ncbi:lipopolysaccharide biosynthesis protein [Duganella qianjiadongensis]|uniref:Oligosaccharide flippase family protein n=1 Tax=Duganella qianjiadongensis TaxID=2692176 RepID=A0ABW9VM50_9BURK|nr:oligosaccharide flippase family protein [Duganella qianjiadongensis]MYM40171.1 oligosaccharide flippase family protein [Duganella qianjiadongensis]